MRVMIAGIDGYIGWALACHLGARSDVELCGVDNFFRRDWVNEVGSSSVVPISDMGARLQAFNQKFRKPILFHESDLRNYDEVASAIREFRPDAIVHLGECSSAPFSMIDVHHATFVQVNNLTTTFNLMFAINDLVPDCHLIKIGTMGEYGTPNVPIPEGFFEVKWGEHRDRLPFPRQAGSWYHWSKVHGSNNMMYASRLWGLRATDIMQGIVYGVQQGIVGNGPLATRLDADSHFGTVAHRFAVQATLDKVLTVYGSGTQKRGFISLSEALQCLTLLIDSPPERGEYRVINQFETVMSVNDVASIVIAAARNRGIQGTVKHIDNPRMEATDHLYKPSRETLPRLGYTHGPPMSQEVSALLDVVTANRTQAERITEVMEPRTMWRPKPTLAAASAASVS